MDSLDLHTEFLFSGGDDFAERQFIAFASDILELRDESEEATLSVAKSMIRAALYTIQERCPLRYTEFLAYEVAKPALDEMDRVDDWVERNCDQTS